MVATSYTWLFKLSKIKYVSLSETLEFENVESEHCSFFLLSLEISYHSEQSPVVDFYSWRLLS